VLELVDHALKSATEAGKKTSNEADEAFTNAASKLSDYGRVYHPNVTVAERIEMAEKTDKSSLKLLNRMMETFRVRDLITLLHHTLTLIFRRRRRDGYRKSSFLSTSPFQITIPLL
jgi:hypothetical protein